MQVTVNKPRAAVGAVHNSSIISCSQVCTHRVCVLPAGALQEKYVRSTTCKHVSPAVTAGKSASRLGFISPFSWRSQDRKTNNRLHSTKSLFCLGTETCIIGSSTNKLLSSALSTVSKQKQADWMRTDPATQVQKVNCLSAVEINVWGGFWAFSNADGYIRVLWRVYVDFWQYILNWSNLSVLCWEIRQHPLCVRADIDYKWLEMLVGL